KCPDFAKLTPTAKLTGDIQFGSELEHPREWYGRVFTGFVKVPADGLYRFDLTSDDGSKLLIDGELAVDNDGLHSSATKTGHLPLAAGWHAIRLEWFNASGGADLKLVWAKDGGTLKPVSGLMH
ncbi:MAG: PA14 domain-containing protein, partial [bacterium]